MKSQDTKDCLKVLSDSVSLDMQQRIDRINDLGYFYKIVSQDDKKLEGKYFDKFVDIIVYRYDTQIGAIAIKFVTHNYSKIADTLFECMLGESANFKSQGIQMYHLMVFPRLLPFFDDSGQLVQLETIDKKALQRYKVLSKDRIGIGEFIHTPKRVLLNVIKLPIKKKLPYKNIQEYKEYYVKNDFEIEFDMRVIDFANVVIYNDYDIFMKKAVYGILGY